MLERHGDYLHPTGDISPPSAGVTELVWTRRPCQAVL